MKKHVDRRSSLMLSAFRRWVSNNQQSGLVQGAATGLNSVGLKKLAVDRLFRSAPTPSAEVKEFCEALLRELREEISTLMEGSTPVIVGPWVSEVGYELLYWIPFLRWVFKDHSLIKNRRVIFLSRGGVSEWYGGLHVHGEYIDLFDLYSVGEFVALNERRIADSYSLQKQLTISPVDKEMCDAVARHLSLDNYTMLHPSVMYNSYEPVWFGHVPQRVIAETTIHRRIVSKRMDILFDLPTDYVAVKFYSRPSFPLNDQNRNIVDQFVRNLASKANVVVLNTSLQVDDHAEFAMPDLPNVFAVPELAVPNTNLALQSEIIAGARALYGTYGGFSYLGPTYGIPSMGLISQGKHFIKMHGNIVYTFLERVDSTMSIVESEDVGMLLS